MEHLNNIEKLLNRINATLFMYNTPNHGITIGKVNAEYVFNDLKEVSKELDELRKIQNYSNASAPAMEEHRKEMVNHPSHYKSGNIECIETMLDVFGKDKVSAFCELNAFKYQWRSNSKGTNIQDKEKAIWYLSKYNELNKE